MQVQLSIGQLWRVSKGARTLATIIAVSISVAACGGDNSGGSGSSSANKGPIKIGTLESTSGVLSTYGVPEKQAIEMAIKEANDAGGVSGRKLEWTFYDPKGDAATGVSLTRRLVTENQVALVIGGGTSSGMAIAMNQVLTPPGIFFASGEGALPITTPVSEHPITFQTALSSALVVDRMLKYLQQKKVTQAAFFADSTETSQTALTAARASAAKYGVSLDTITYDPASSDLTAQLTKAAAANPGAYLNFTVTPSGVVFMKNAQLLGLNKKAIIMESYTYSDPSVMKQGAAASVGVIVAVSKLSVADELPSSDPQKARLEKFAKSYKAAYDQPISIYAAEAYDAVAITLEALRRTGGDTNAKKMATALEQKPYIGIQGTYRFSATDHAGLSSDDVVVAMWDGSQFRLQT